MITLKKSLVGAALFASALVANATVSFTGVAFLNAPGISVGDVSVLLIDNNGSGFDSFNLVGGEDIFAAATYGDFTVGPAVRIASLAGSNTILSGAYSGIALTGGVSSGDRFAIVTFADSTTTATPGDTYTIWTDPTWLVPADGATLSYNANPTSPNFKQLGTTATAFSIKTVPAVPVPEPSSFAALAGLSVLGFVASRRRRAS